MTLPYSEGQWQNIDALGRQVDGMLRASDVRLTMGGEPTFVSIDDRDGDEWNTLALGPDKRKRAGGLLRKRARPFRLRAGCCTSASGKWYPGEARCRVLEPRPVTGATRLAWPRLARPCSDRGR